MKKLLFKQTALLVFLPLLLAACSSGDTLPQAAPAPVIETFQLKKEKLSTELRLPAELSGFQQVDIYAKVTGFVESVKADIGTEVKEGQLLLVLEAPEISSQLAASEARMKAQEAVYIASKSTYNRLLETSRTAGTVSPNELEQARAKYTADQAQWEAAKASNRELAIVKGYLDIRAPFDGVVAARSVNPGAYVGPSGKGSEFPLFTIQQQKKLRLAVAVPEMYTGYLRKGDELTFQVKSLPGQEFKAVIARMAGALDLKLRAERIEMDVLNERKTLLPGMIAEVVLPLTARVSSFVVPKTAVVSSAEGVFVIRVVNGRTKRVPVIKGREQDDKVEIFGNLSVNDKLVKMSSEELRDGTEI